MNERFHFSNSWRRHAQIFRAGRSKDLGSLIAAALLSSAYIFLDQKKYQLLNIIIYNELQLTK